MNQIFCIEPYQTKNGTWVFDDEKRDLIQEPFVSGMDTILDYVTKKNKTTLYFSNIPFPGVTHILTLDKKDMGGGWYSLAETQYKGWLCPALLKYFDKIPPRIYVQVKE